MAGKITKQELAASLVSDIEQGAIVQQPTPPSGTKEGRLWLDTSDSAYQGTVLDGILDFNPNLKVTRSSKDSEGIFTIYEQRREDGTLAVKSVLSGGISPLYSKRTITYYAPNGTTVSKIVTRTLNYDADGDLVSEV